MGKLRKKRSETYHKFLEAINFCEKYLEDFKTYFIADIATQPNEHGTLNYFVELQRGEMQKSQVILFKPDDLAMVHSYEKEITIADIERDNDVHFERIDPELKETMRPYFCDLIQKQIYKYYKEAKKH